jgi:hypothetical protein
MLKHVLARTLAHFHALGGMIKQVLKLLLKIKRIIRPHDETQSMRGRATMIRSTHQCSPGAYDLFSASAL